MTAHISGRRAPPSPDQSVSDITDDRHNIAQDSTTGLQSKLKQSGAAQPAGRPTTGGRGRTVAEGEGEGREDRGMGCRGWRDEEKGRRREVKVKKGEDR